MAFDANKSKIYLFPETSWCSTLVTSRGRGERAGRAGMKKLKVLTEERQRCFAHAELTPVSSRIERHRF